MIPKRRKCIDIPERKSWNWISAKVGGTGVKEARTTNLKEEAKEAKLNLRAKEHKEREEQGIGVQLQQQLQSINMASSWKFQGHIKLRKLGSCCHMVMIV